MTSLESVIIAWVVVFILAIILAVFQAKTNDGQPRGLGAIRERKDERRPH